MNICLGAFKTSYYDLADTYSAQPYDKFYNKAVTRKSIRNFMVLFQKKWGNVCQATEQAKTIFFDLTNLWFPFEGEDVITLAEFQWVVEQEHLFNKTRFFANGVELDGELVRLAWINNEKVRFGQNPEKFIKETGE